MIYGGVLFAGGTGKNSATIHICRTLPAGKQQPKAEMPLRVEVMKDIDIDSCSDKMDVFSKTYESIKRLIFNINF